MRKTILILLSSLILIGMSAQTNMTSISKNELKTNEIDSRDGDIMITPKSMITSSNVLLYDIKDFFKVYDAQDKELIGCPVICQVLQVRKSNIMGSEGRLVIRPLYIKKGDEKINVFWRYICKRPESYQCEVLVDFPSSPHIHPRHRCKNLSQ